MALPTRPRFKAPPHPALDYRPPRALRLIRTATIAFISLASLTIAYVVWWFVLAVLLNTGADAWIAQRAAEGWSVEMTRREVEGFPLRLRLAVSNPRLSRADGLSWSADRLEAVSLPVPGGPVTVRTFGAQTLTLPAEPGGAPAKFAGTADEIAVELPGLTAAPNDVTVRLLGVSLAAGTRPLGIDKAEVRVVRTGDAKADHKALSATVSATAEGIRVPASAGFPLGDVVHSAQMDARLLGPIDWSLPLGEALAVWRDIGGTVELSALEMRYGPMWMRASGTLALDGALQPVGAGTAKMRGFFDAIDEMRRRGMIEAKPAITAKLVLGAFARKAADGGPPVLNLPFSLQERMLHIGPVPLVPVPPIHWPGAPAAPEKKPPENAA